MGREQWRMSERSERRGIVDERNSGRVRE
jgi:hypothetical protein